MIANRFWSTPWCSQRFFDPLLASHPDGLHYAFEHLLGRRLRRELGVVVGGVVAVSRVEVFHVPLDFVCEVQLDAFDPGEQLAMVELCVWWGEGGG